MWHHQVLLIVAALFLFCRASIAQSIDFETIGDDFPTTDGMTISVEYLVRYGVQFSLVDEATLEFIGYPKIAKVGDPLTAFVGCNGSDTPRPGQSIGQSFLTDDGALGASAALLIEYPLVPVKAASGVIIDVDCRPPAGAPPCELWVIVAYNELGVPVASATIGAPLGPSGACEPDADGGVGDGKAFPFSFVLDDPVIRSIVIAYKGSADPGSVGLAFDNLSASEPAPPISVALDTGPLNTCLGSPIDLIPAVDGGLGDLQYSWQQRASVLDPWVQFSTVEVPVVVQTKETSVEYRLVVTDTISVGTSETITIAPGAERRVRATINSVPVGADITAFVLQDTPVADLWGPDPTIFAGDFIDTQPDRMHIAAVVTEEGPALVVVHSDMSSPNDGFIRTEILASGFESRFLFQDDPPMAPYNDTYTEMFAGPLQTLFGATQTWGINKTDGYAIGPADDDSTFTLRIPPDTPLPEGVSSGAIYSADGMTYPFDPVPGLEIELEFDCGACPADLADPIGTLNFNDVVTFLTAFAGMDPAADFAEPFGTLNFNDVIAFLNVFAAGCP